MYQGYYLGQLVHLRWERGRIPEVSLNKKMRNYSSLFVVTSSLSENTQGMELAQFIYAGTEEKIFL